MNLLKLLKSNWLLIAIVLLALLVRLIGINNVPSGLSNDELDYILNAKAVFYQWSDISNTWNPLSLTTPASSFPQAELPPVLFSLIVGILPFSLLFSKIGYVAVSVGTVVLVYLIARKLLGEKPALVSSCMAAVNPWLIFFGRTAYDTPVAIFCFLVSFYILLVAKGWKILIAFPFLFVGFYSYIGTKALLMPFVVIVTFYSWIVVNKKRFTKQYIVLNILCLLTVGYYAISVFNSNGSRVNEIATPQMQSIIDATNLERKMSVINPVSIIFSNKYIVFLKYSLDKYLNAFSPNFLFLHGDSKALFTLWEHGVYYYIDIVTILAGFYYLLVKKKKEVLLLGSLVLIGPIPVLLSNVGVSYAIRALLIAPILCMVIGFGIYSLITTIKMKLTKKVVIACIAVIYIALFANFLNIYFFRNPIYNSESFNLSSRIMAKYVSLAEDNVVIVSSNPKTQFKQLLFYNNLFENEDKHTVARMFASNTFSFKNVSLVDCEGAAKVNENVTLLYEIGSKCNELQNLEHDVSIVQLGDSGALYHIKNDRVCNSFRLRKFIFGVKFSDLNIEKLDKQRFCETFIIK